MPQVQKEQIRNGDQMKEHKLQGSLKYRVERNYTGTCSFDEVVARICRVYRNKQRYLNE